MPFYEAIFEVGEHSVLEANSDDEVVEFAKVQHQRAKSGLPNGPAGDRADRIVRILKYDTHPGEDKLLFSAKEAQARFKEVADEYTDGGNVNLPEVARTLMPPVVLDTPVHDSNYALKSVDELDPESWGGDPL